MNKRLIAVGIFLGIAIGIAFFVGCPNKAIGCLAFDIGRQLFILNLFFAFSSINNDFSICSSVSLAVIEILILA